MKYFLVIAVACISYGMVFAQGPAYERPESGRPISDEGPIRPKQKLIPIDEGGIEIQVKGRVGKGMKGEVSGSTTITVSHPEDIRPMRRDVKADKKTDMAERRMEIKRRVASTTEDKKINVDAKKKARIEGRLVHISSKFNAAVSRIDMFDAKVEIAIKHFNDKGVDTDVAQELLDAARDELEHTKKLIAEFASSTASVLGKDEVSKVEIKTEIKIVMESMRATHAAYVDVIAELNASQREKPSQEIKDRDKSGSASTTATTTESN